MTMRAISLALKVESPIFYFLFFFCVSEPFKHKEKIHVQLLKLSCCKMF